MILLDADARPYFSNGGSDFHPCSFKVGDQVTNDQPIQINGGTIPALAEGFVQNYNWDDDLCDECGGWRVLVSWKWGESHPGTRCNVKEGEIRRV